MKLGKPRNKKAASRKRSSPPIGLLLGDLGKTTNIGCPRDDSLPIKQGNRRTADILGG
jgi:hypothetical protein